MRKITVLIVALLFIGCAKSEFEQKIVGKWEKITDTPDIERVFMVYNSDLTGYQERIASPWSARIHKRDYWKFDFTYKIENKHLIQNEKGLFEIILLNDTELIVRYIGIVNEKPEKEEDQTVYRYKRVM